MRQTRTFLFFSLILLPLGWAQQASAPPRTTAAIPGFYSSSIAAQQKAEKEFLAVPDPKRAEEHLRILTAEPHIASSPEDHKTAEYVAKKFRENGLATEIVEYRVWMNLPAEISLEIKSPKAGRSHHVPTPERVSNDPFQNDPRVVQAFNAYAPSGEADAEVIYANYGRPEDFKKLEEMKVDVRGKIVLVRYGENYRGVKPYVAQQRGAAGVIIYSDPIDDGYFKGDAYPKGPWRPESAVQRGSVKFMFKYPGDPTTPGVASTVNLPDSERVAPQAADDLPKIPTTPLSYGDARPILENLAGPESPREWQGALPFTYHVGPGPVRVRMVLKQNYQYRTIWNVIGKVEGSEYPNEWVIAGNHRDAWVYGAVDPNSGTMAMLEAVQGIGELLKTGWKPKRTIVFGSWDAEEQGLIGSTEWVEEHSRELANAAAYFNVDVAVSGPNFSSSAVPSLKQFLREVAKAVPSPTGASVYDVWKEQKRKEAEKAPATGSAAVPRPVPGGDVPVGDLGSGSDYTPFLQHLGVPSTDIGSTGAYGVYHSVFDNFNWFKKFGDPQFLYAQQMARIFGLEILRMANADVLPYDFENYGKEITGYIQAAQKKSETAFKGKAAAPDFRPALEAAKRLTVAGTGMAKSQMDGVAADTAKLNRGLVGAERALLLPQGLPNRPWFRHAIYAPGEYTGYAAVVIPGVNEAIDGANSQTTQEQITALADALNRAAQTLEASVPQPVANGQ